MFVMGLPPRTSIVSDVMTSARLSENGRRRTRMGGEGRHGRWMHSRAPASHDSASLGIAERASEERGGLDREGGREALSGTHFLLSFSAMRSIGTPHTAHEHDTLWSVAVRSGAEEGRS